MQYFFIFLFSFGHCLIGVAQTYDYSYKKNKVQWYAALVFDLGARAYGILRTGNQLTSQAQVNVQNIWAIDRGAVGNFSKSSDQISDYLLYGSVVTPLVFSLAELPVGDSFGNIFLMGLQGFLIQDGIVQTTKMIVGRPRPYIYDEGVSAINRSLSKTDLKSFPSGHTATASYFCFFTAKIYSDIYPDSPWEPVVWSSAVLLPAVTAYLRYDAGKHFPTDLVVAYGVGAFFGIMVPEFYKNDKLLIAVGNGGLMINIKI